MLINFEKTLNNLSKILVDKNLKLSLCESCTGGLISKICTDYSGSSKWFLGSIVTYSNDMKEVIGVNQETLEKYGAVSENTAQEMSLATLAFTNSDICLSVTGIAGPNGGSDEKPVGTVYFSYSDKYSSSITKKIIFKGSRKEIRYRAAKESIQIILDCAADIKTQ